MAKKLIITGRFNRIILLCHLLNAILCHFLPKKLSSLILLPLSWLPDKAAAAAAAATAASASSITSDHQGVRKENSRRKEEVNKMSVESATTSTPRAGQEPVDPAELKRVFQMFDRNGDGTITNKELSDSLENLGIYIPEEELAAMIEQIDVNGDGCVDIDEFGTLYKTIMDERDEEEDMREAFNVFDQNGDGFITVDELRSVLASLGLKQGRTVEDCRRMINKVDVDGDGKVNFKEFKQMMRGKGFAALS